MPNSFFIRFASESMGCQNVQSSLALTPSRGNIVTCIALLFCCMLSIISCVLIVIKNYKNNK
ncbi:hypothetical protein DXB69_10450 [Agathobacter rectalis]|uniref:Uncharacterized protein n=1 Tax=Agathobacter rectalis TaxID=39491 RepID=A0A3E5AMR0_9FIRM|nr:hypothetical protein DXB76_09155 [Agathobacter rectalis]RGN22628.1 hypothetical protein DXB69_10450 [Agathobacter rectalis]RGN22994.1 hypothetical protein DXB72_08180 [Agathobacter rectalis]